MHISTTGCKKFFQDKKGLRKKDVHAFGKNEDSNEVPRTYAVTVGSYVTKERVLHVC